MQIQHEKLDLHMIERKDYLRWIEDRFEVFPICGLLGPRQCGKTTLALQYAARFQTFTHFDLEDPSHYDQLTNPKLTLEGLRGLVIIDEIQRMPELYLYLRVLVDRNSQIKILLLGSASPELLEKSAETLAGRISYLELTPFNMNEVTDDQKLWSWGGYPKAFLASSSEKSNLWRKEYITSFLERDLGVLGFNVSHQTMRKLWTMIAHTHGNLLNYTDLGRSLNVSDTTIKRYLDVLDQAFMIRLLKPWHENMSKRQVKAPKPYIRDSGLLHTLLGIGDENLQTHPKLGASWEGFALEEIIRCLNFSSEDCYFWRTQRGEELDLLVYRQGQKVGFEFKYADNPKLTASMNLACEDLSLKHLYVITPTSRTHKISDNITVYGLREFINDAQKMDLFDHF